jgi:hypothetical protein
MDIADFEGQYNSPTGKGTASSFTLPTVSAPSAKVSIEVEKLGDGFRLISPEQTIDWDNPPELVSEIEEGQWAGANLKVTQNTLTLALARLTGKDATSTLAITDAKASCISSGLDHGDQLKNLLEACLNKQSDLSVKSFATTSTQKGGASNPLFDFLEKLLSPSRGASSLDRIDNFKMTNRNHAFDLQVTAKVVITATVKARGEIHYDVNQNQIRIRLDQAKAGILNIKDKIFDELEKSQSNQLRVEKPWIILTLE